VHATIYTLEAKEKMDETAETLIPPQYVPWLSKTVQQSQIWKDAYS